MSNLKCRVVPIKGGAYLRHDCFLVMIHISKLRTQKKVKSVVVSSLGAARHYLKSHKKELEIRSWWRAMHLLGNKEKFCGLPPGKGSTMHNEFGPNQEGEVRKFIQEFMKQYTKPFRSLEN